MQQLQVDIQNFENSRLIADYNIPWTYKIVKGGSNKIKVKLGKVINY